jgi:hypothetical protein
MTSGSSLTLVNLSGFDFSKTEPFFRSRLGIALNCRLDRQYKRRRQLFELGGVSGNEQWVVCTLKENICNI